jgi:hypothetical protein
MTHPDITGNPDDLYIQLIVISEGLLYVVRQFISRNGVVRQTHVHKHVCTCLNFHLHDVQTK